eukprot:g72379.t1
MAFAGFYDTLVNKGVFAKVEIFGNVKWGHNVNFDKFQEQIQTNAWSEYLFMLELLPGHSQQDVLPNIAQFIKKCHQGSQDPARRHNGVEQVPLRGCPGANCRATVCLSRRGSQDESK